MALGGKKGAGYKASETIRRLEGLRKDSTTTVCFRMKPREVDKLRAMADKRGLKLSQLVKSWIVERMNS